MNVDQFRELAMNYVLGELRLKVKKLDEAAVIPSYAKDGDAGMDLTATSKEFEKRSSGEKVLTYGTGLAVAIPVGYVGLLFPRSSISKTSLQLANCVGVIDSGYRGEVKLKFKVDASARPSKESVYEVGDRIGQLIILPFPYIDVLEVDELSTTERGSGGFGSSGS